HVNDSQGQVEEGQVDNDQGQASVSPPNDGVSPSVDVDEDSDQVRSYSQGGHSNHGDDQVVAQESHLETQARRQAYRLAKLIKDGH
ncbi:hypothetical protein Q8G71_35790, partial [Klebsiella pneumoniae]